DAGGGAGAQVGGLPAPFERDAAVLRLVPDGDVHVPHDLHARDQASGHVAREGGVVDEASVDAVADAHSVRGGLEVDVAGALLERFGDDHVDVVHRGAVDVLLDLFAGVGGLLGGAVVVEPQARGFGWVVAVDERRELFGRRV